MFLTLTWCCLSTLRQLGILHALSYKAMSALYHVMLYHLPVVCFLLCLRCVRAHFHPFTNASCLSGVTVCHQFSMSCSTYCLHGVQTWYTYFSNQHFQVKRYSRRLSFFAEVVSEEDFFGEDKERQKETKRQLNAMCNFWIGSLRTVDNIWIWTVDLIIVDQC